MVEISLRLLAALVRVTTCICPQSLQPKKGCRLVEVKRSVMKSYTNNLIFLRVLCNMIVKSAMAVARDQE